MRQIMMALATAVALFASFGVAEAQMTRANPAKEKCYETGGTGWLANQTPHCVCPPGKVNAYTMDDRCDPANDYCVDAPTPRPPPAADRPATPSAPAPPRDSPRPTPPPTSRCGDGRCTGSEDRWNCNRDCGYCGDRVCNTDTETKDSCPADCVPRRAAPPSVAPPPPAPRADAAPVDPDAACQARCEEQSEVATWDGRTKQCEPKDPKYFMPAGRCTVIGRPGKDGTDGKPGAAAPRNIFELLHLGASTLGAGMWGERDQDFSLGLGAALSLDALTGYYSGTDPAAVLDANFEGGLLTAFDRDRPLGWFAVGEARFWPWRHVGFVGGGHALGVKTDQSGVNEATVIHGHGGIALRFVGDHLQVVLRGGAGAQVTEEPKDDVSAGYAVTFEGRL